MDVIQNVAHQLIKPNKIFFTTTLKSGFGESVSVVQTIFVIDKNEQSIYNVYYTVIFTLSELSWLLHDRVNKLLHTNCIEIHVNMLRIHYLPRIFVDIIF